MTFNRDLYLQRLISASRNDMIKIITGIRRCGKSYLLFEIFRNYLLSQGVHEDHIIGLAMDDNRNKALREPDNLLEYIDSHLSEIHSAEDLSRGLHMSKSVLYRLFSLQLDTPLMTYVRTQQCLLARRYLMEGVPATDVAMRLGFAHYSSFYREYCKIFHASPAKAQQSSQ